jgi:hypothetical protein
MMVFRRNVRPLPLMRQTLISQAEKGAEKQSMALGSRAIDARQKL